MTKNTLGNILNPDFRPTNNISSLLNNLKRIFEEESAKLPKTNDEKVKEIFEINKIRFLDFYTMGLRDYEAKLNTQQKVIQIDCDSSFYMCPNCEKQINKPYNNMTCKSSRSMARCPHCGQLFDWG